MENGLYRPVMDENHHLVQSRKNPDRVRGLSRNADNKDQRIIEWEYVGTAEEIERTNLPYEENGLSPKEREIAEIIATAISTAIVESTVIIVEDIFIPWWKETGWPKLKEKGKFIYDVVTAKKTRAEILMEEANRTTEIDDHWDEISVRDLLLRYLENCDEDADGHIQNAVYHFLAFAKEIRYISINASRSEGAIDVDKAKAIEASFVAQVSSCLDNYLSHKTLLLDNHSSDIIFSCLGGGIKRDGVYLPVNKDKLMQRLCYEEETRDALER